MLLYAVQCFTLAQAPHRLRMHNLSQNAFSTTLNNDCQVGATKLEVAPLPQNTTCLVALLCSGVACWWRNWHLSFSTIGCSHYYCHNLSQSSGKREREKKKVVFDSFMIDRRKTFPAVKLFRGGGGGNFFGHVKREHWKGFCFRVNLIKSLPPRLLKVLHKYNHYYLF